MRQYVFVEIHKVNDKYDTTQVDTYAKGGYTVDSVTSINGTSVLVVCMSREIGQ